MTYIHSANLGMFFCWLCRIIRATSKHPAHTGIHAGLCWLSKKLTMTRIHSQYSGTFICWLCRDYVLKSTGSINETGEVAVEVLLCNLLAFAIVFLVLVKGIQSLGKVRETCDLILEKG